MVKKLNRRHYEKNNLIVVSRDIEDIEANNISSDSTDELEGSAEKIDYQINESESTDSTQQSEPATTPSVPSGI